MALPAPIHLTGMTWNHTRGYTPMVATTQRFCEMRLVNDLSITWEKRSLQEFADQSIDSLAKKYDLLVIDHPWVGHAAASGVLVPLDQHLPPEFLADQAANSVGKSHESYQFNGHQWALAIDAAAPVCAYRPDLISEPPKTWEEMIALGKAGLVCCPSIPLDTFCNFVNLCESAGAALFADHERVVPRDDGRAAMERLKELASVVPKKFFNLNPIWTLELMSQGDAHAYCPFTYGYSNYARPGFADKVVRFGEPMRAVADRPASTLLGGTGLAISARCSHLNEAVQYARFVAAPQTQRGIYFESGGQPGHRGAWLDEKVNAASSNYFADTLPALDRAFVRPRFDGFLKFQDHAGEPIHNWLREGGDVDRVLDQLDALYRKHGGKPA